MSNTESSRLRIVVAGASGYIGRAVIPRLLEKFPTAEITALSRSPQHSEQQRLSWKACELFSLKSLEEALPPQADLAIYLVHSMGPTAQLDQGSFADYDLILADNFARMAKKLGVRQLIYLGGLTPESGALSLHLQSRMEVEDTFREYQLPLTVFRAGLILGEAGSSSQILLKLVKRLPVMICPQWTQTLTTPVDLETVLHSLTASALKESCLNRVYDLAGCQPLTYLQMMKETARRLGKKRYFFSVPFFTPTLSRLWVSLITNTPKDLVYPLIESLEHPMVARTTHLFNVEGSKRSYAELLEKASVRTHSKRFLFHFRPRSRTVRSVQRLPLPTGRDAQWVMERYAQWLPRFLFPFVKVRREGASVVFSLFGLRWVLLDLHLSMERSNPDRQLLYIQKGLLVGKGNRGRLEFRVVLRRKYVLAAIHDYGPALPWYIYKYTQARVHLLVMRAFGRALARE